ncbi:hypothetical protein CLAIMM_01680, partial [Cladophialophora immunda]
MIVRHKLSRVEAPGILEVAGLRASDRSLRLDHEKVNSSRRKWNGHPACAVQPIDLDMVSIESPGHIGVAIPSSLGAKGKIASPDMVNFMDEHPRLHGRLPPPAILKMSWW